MIAELQSAATALQRAASDPTTLETLTVGELAAVVTTIQAVQRHARALLLEATAVADRNDVAKAQGATSTGAWLAQHSGTSQRDAAREVRLAHQLRDDAPRTREAMTTPGMSADKARVIAGAMRRLPADLTPDDRDRVEADLVTKAQRHNLEDLQRAAKRALDVLDTSRADAAESDTLRAEERHGRRHTTFWLGRPDTDGMVEGGFTVDALTADMLRSILDSYTAPRKHTCDNTDGGTIPATSSKSGNSGNTARGTDYLHKMGTAFTQIVRHLPRDSYGNHGGIAATLVVTLDEDSLRGRLDRAGTTSHGTRVSPSQLRQLACNADLIPAVLSSEGHVLDLGRTQRLFSPAQRLALAQRDGGCAFPGCDRPPGWCEAHHIDPWSTGGTTNLDNGVLVCAAHHQRLHHGGWQVRVAADGHPEFIPPPRLDPHQQPQRNDRWRPQTRA